MFDIKKCDCVGQTNKLLYNIWQELKNKTTHEATEKPQITENKIHEYLCKIEGCGFKTENKGIYLAHCKGHKNNG